MVSRGRNFGLLMVCAAMYAPTVGGTFGCARPVTDLGPMALNVPADFALVLHIQGAAPAHEPESYTSQYIIEPDRKLRVALGMGAAPDYFPRVTCRLTHGQYTLVYQNIRDNHLMAEPISPNAELDAKGERVAPVLYEVAITSNGRTHRYATTPDESPPTLELVTQLIELRGPYLPVPSIPARSDRAIGR